MEVDAESRPESSTGAPSKDINTLEHPAVDEVEEFNGHLKRLPQTNNYTKYKGFLIYGLQYPTNILSGYADRVKGDSYYVCQLHYKPASFSCFSCRLYSEKGTIAGSVGVFEFMPVPNMRDYEELTKEIWKCYGNVAPVKVKIMRRPGEYEQGCAMLALVHAYIFVDEQPFWNEIYKKQFRPHVLKKWMDDWRDGNMHPPENFDTKIAFVKHPNVILPITQTVIDEIEARESIPDISTSSGTTPTLRMPKHTKTRRNVGSAKKGSQGRRGSQIDKRDTTSASDTEAESVDPRQNARHKSQSEIFPSETSMETDDAAAPTKSKGKPGFTNPKTMEIGKIVNDLLLKSQKFGRIPKFLANMAFRPDKSFSDESDDLILFKRKEYAFLLEELTGVLNQNGARFPKHRLYYYVSGPPGTGKSCAALSFAICAASGKAVNNLNDDTKLVRLDAQWAVRWIKLPDNSHSLGTCINFSNDGEQLKTTIEEFKGCGEGVVTELLSDIDDQERRVVFIDGYRQEEFIKDLEVRFKNWRKADSLLTGGNVADLKKKRRLIFISSMDAKSPSDGNKGCKVTHCSWTTAEFTAAVMNDEFYNSVRETFEEDYLDDLDIGETLKQIEMPKTAQKQPNTEQDEIMPPTAELDEITPLTAEQDEMTAEQNEKKPLTVQEAKKLLIKKKTGVAGSSARYMFFYNLQEIRDDINSAFEDDELVKDKTKTSKLYGRERESLDETFSVYLSRYVINKFNQMGKPEAVKKEWNKTVFNKRAAFHGNYFERFIFAITRHGISTGDDVTRSTTFSIKAYKGSPIFP
ncbi:uncharacterized protein LOC129589506 isoform X1 [Paramacrobiotus metropolitanus]|uniref:uncharacterized protein LOC129589506 isoform X1 n=1 Tax=Paramacrobiotus metropolitanus TaxID=2943436 RepID=UPI0024461B50|nr:uncharacterized protein LOC129589506 isoform X1 [Paramacrobiotus metropolitanus]XP_055340263.1 uncharacterized protein LOC129589506 isoform X1 [Paramacrobiotus metropolitanus]